MMRICGTIYAWTDAWDFKTWYNWSTIFHWNWSMKRQLFIWLFFISDSQYSPLPKKVTQSSSKLISVLLTSRSDLFFENCVFCVISLKLFQVVGKGWGPHILFTACLWLFFKDFSILSAKDGEKIFYWKRVVTIHIRCMGKCHGETKRSRVWLLSLRQLISFYLIKLDLRSAVSITQILLLAPICQDYLWSEQNH